MILITYQTVVRTVGEQLSQQSGVGLAVWLEPLEDNEVYTNRLLMPLSSVINLSNQMSQFMDQTKSTVT
jgi:hypothetical protein